MKKILIGFLLGATILTFTACSKPKQELDKSETSTSTKKKSESSSTPSSKRNESSATVQETTAVSEVLENTLVKFIGDWELKIYGQEGYRLSIAKDQFQFYTLYDGHAAPPNNENVTYQIDSRGKVLTVKGDRAVGNLERGETLGNGKARDEIVITIDEKKAEPTLTIVINGESIALSDKERAFTKLSETPNIVAWP